MPESKLYIGLTQCITKQTSIGLEAGQADLGSVIVYTCGAGGGRVTLNHMVSTVYEAECSTCGPLGLVRFNEKEELAKTPVPDTQSHQRDMLCIVEEKFFGPYLSTEELALLDEPLRSLRTNCYFTGATIVATKDRRTKNCHFNCQNCGQYYERKSNKKP